MCPMHLTRLLQKGKKGLAVDRGKRVEDLGRHGFAGNHSIRVARGAREVKTVQSRIFSFIYSMRRKSL
jgi:hypothetical protein